ncbi:MAG: acylphosphatase [Dehalococcoidia bacterium]|nr:acylphosphatase [Dehalococcoidia bacterium]
MEIQRRRYLLRGRVQGVGFRLFAATAARQLALTGGVRNLPDGRSVEATAEGPAAQLDRFGRLLREGPPGAFVAEWEENPIARDGKLEGFAVWH